MADLSIRAVENSNLPIAQKSALRRMLDRGLRGVGDIKGHATAGGHAVRAGAEGAIVGGLLGLAHASLPHGLDADAKGEIPMDAIGGAMLLAAATFMGGHAESAPFAEDARNAGATMLGVASFRHSYAYIAARRAKANKSVGGKFATFKGEAEMAGDEDPIVARARQFKAYG